MSVYLPAQYADPTTHYPIYEKLMDYQQAHPNIELTFVSPASSDLAEREAVISQLSAEILSGGGPDLFIMEGYRRTESNLFPDIEKAMANGTFLDLTEAMEKQGLSREEDFYTADIAYDLARGLFNDADPAQVRDGFAGGVPFALLQDSKFSINLLRQCQALGVEASVLPVPNEEGTFTAKIGSYAMGSRNTQHPEEVADLLLYLISEECQSAAAYADYDQFPVRKGCMQACFDAQYQFSACDASREKLTEEEVAERQGRYGAPLDAARIEQFETICDQVTAAHYQTIWYRGVDLGQTETGENVASFLHVQYWNDEITLDELIGILSSKMRLYLDE